MRRIRLKGFMPLGIGLALVVVPLRAQFVYIANGGGSNDVSGYRIGLDGALASLVGSPFTAGSLPSSVTVEPAGRFAYVVNEGGDSISGYRIGSDGALLPVPGSPFAT